MVEAKNFVEKELGKELNNEENIEKNLEIKEQEKIPTYIPPPPPQQEKQPEELNIIEKPVIQIIEKIVYKKQKIHGFFRILTIIILIVIWFLMLGESTDIVKLSINNFTLHTIYPLIIILSAIILRSYKWLFGKIFWLILFLWIFGWIFGVGIYTSLNPTTQWKEWVNIYYTPSQTGINNIHIDTLIGNSYIEGSKKNTSIQWTRNSDRKLDTQIGNKKNIYNLYFKENRNRNVIQHYQSNIDLTIPYSRNMETIYVKNILWLHTIDLKDIQRKNIKTHGGIQDITIRVDNVLSGNKIEIQWIAANVDILLPKNIWVIVYHKHRLGKLQISWFEETEKRYYQSQNIKNAKAILHIYINLWVSNTKINWKN